jgi:anti-sigma regulatory factor (Ser/Thr protein kinase)
MTNQAKNILKFLLAKVAKHPDDLVAVAVQHFSVTRTTIHRHLSKLLTEGKILKNGTTRNITYYLSTDANRTNTYKIHPQLSEFTVYKNDFSSALASVDTHIQDICHYAFTEIFNNAIDHSAGTKILASLTFEKNNIVISIQDNGIGIFKNLHDYFLLDDIREGALQLSKGKMTTDPSNHTGEGIFFSSRAMDTFEITSNNLHYIKSNKDNDWGLECIPEKMKGTTVTMTINKNSQRKLNAIFCEYQDEEDLKFDKTDILVEMAKWGDETLISRSQAKRILRNLEKFNHVTLDFKGVRLIGQGFVDETFRVFINRFPHVRITYINASDDVEFMIKRGMI